MGDALEERCRELEEQLHAARVQSAGRAAELETLKRALEVEVTARRRADVVVRQAYSAFQNTAEGCVITDQDQRILAVNQAFTNVTGYEPGEVIGMTPRLLKSGRHDGSFYAAMWGSIRETGRWEGEIWNRRKDGSIYPEFLKISAIRDESGAVVNYMALFLDISSMKESEARFDRLAHYDPLTDLPNRLLLRARFEYAAEQAARLGRRLAVVIVGVDGFKAFNQTMGMPAGDELLRRIAAILVGNAGEGETVARLAGDEFVILTDEVTDAEKIGKAARGTLGALAREFAIGGRELFLTCSAGISLWPDDGEDFATLLRNAHVALDRAKRSGRNGFQFSTAHMRERADARFHLESDLLRAIRRREFVLHFQPQFSLSSGTLTGVEALARWNHPARGVVLPNDFIPVAEEMGVIESFGSWALDAACTQAMAWRADGLPPFRMAINVSVRQVRSPLIETVSAILRSSGMEPELLELEITEGFLMDHPQEALRALVALKELGVTLAIDDFGTGYSSLSYLKLFPVDKLKIDRSFIRDIPFNANDEAIARAILTLGHGLDLTVIAEGVETEAQAAFLREHECDEAQGYLFGRPVPGEDLAGMVRARREGVQGV